MPGFRPTDSCNHEALATLRLPTRHTDTGSVPAPRVTILRSLDELGARAVRAAPLAMERVPTGCASCSAATLRPQLQTGR